jgi:quercetin 2,3-dioxygenase
MEKLIKKTSKQQFKHNAVGFRSVDMFHSEMNIEPFLVFTEFYMDRPIFGPHPHAGVSVMTYMMPDSKGVFLNRDSRGDHSIIEAGGIHVTQAGSGVYHDEVPTVIGTDCHGFQIWINHADKDRWVAPKAYHALASEVPEYKTDNILLRVIQGSYEGVSSFIELVTKTSLFDVKLGTNTTINFPAQEMAFIYMISGTIAIDNQEIGNNTMVNFQEEGNTITVHTGNSEANFMYASGIPHHEPIVYGGPFVMTTEEQMRETRKRLGRGKMGVLLPL